MIHKIHSHRFAQTHTHTHTHAQKPVKPDHYNSPSSHFIKRTKTEQYLNHLAVACGQSAVPEAGAEPLNEADSLNRVQFSSHQRRILTTLCGRLCLAAVLCGFVLLSSALCSADV